MGYIKKCPLWGSVAVPEPDSEEWSAISVYLTATVSPYLLLCS